VAVAGSIDDHCRYLTALRAAPGQAFSDPVCRSGTTIHRSQLLTTNQCGPGHRSGVSDARRRRLVGPENRRTPVTCEGFHDAAFICAAPGGSAVPRANTTSTSGQAGSAVIEG